MNSEKEFDEFAKKLGISPEQIKRELVKIKEEYGMRDVKEAFSVFKSRIALKHLRESLERK
jgi:FKBP-type peptidyl-prolyl cis-trans isomerase (trigger factor)